MEVSSGDTFGDKITFKFQLEIKTCEYIVEVCLSFGVIKFVKLAYIFRLGIQLWGIL